ncbi:MAG: Gfo/Idh/MocA family oxidoreductase [Eggerthellales bacterium]|nr:Gfo/Idh/MocA family oxidoreductase [Eggerthellales bacterium]
MGRFNLAVLGLNQGAKAARDAIQSEDFVLAAVAGFGAQAESVADELGVPLYADYVDLLQKVDLDAVVIALPNNLHWPAVRAALDAGIRNILLEKPIADTVEDARKIIDACEEEGAKLLIGHQRRSSATMLFLKKFIQDGNLGDIVGLQVSATYAKPDSYYDVAWHTTTGPLLINAIHDVDDIHYVTGMHVKRVYAASRNSIRHGKIEDSCSVLFEFEEGPTCSYFLSDGTPAPWGYDLAAQEMHFINCRPGENSMRVFGTKGSFGLPNMDFYYYDEDHYGWTEPMQKKHFEVGRPDPATATLAHFADLCAGRETVPRCTGEEGLATLKVVQAILESAAKEEIVTLV